MVLGQFINRHSEYKGRYKPVKRNRRLDTQVAYTEDGDPTLKINLPGICKEPSMVIMRDLLLQWRSFRNRVQPAPCVYFNETAVLHKPSENIHRG